MAQARTLSDQELEQVLAYAATTKHGLRNQTILLMTHWAGMRIGEVAAVRYGDVLASDAFSISGYATGTNAGTFTDSLQLTAIRGLLSNYNVTYINRALTIINPNTNSSAGNQSNVSSSNSSAGNQSNVSSGNSSLIYGPTVFPFRNLSVRNQAILDTIASRVSSVVAIPDSKTSMSSVIAGAPLKTQLTASSSAPLTGEAGSAVVMLAPVNNLKDAGLEVDTIKLTSLTNGKGDVPSKAVQELRNNANLNGLDVANNKRVEVNAVTKTNQSLPEGLGFDAKSTSFKSSNPDPKNFPLEVKLQLKVDGKVVSEKVMTLMK